MLTFNSDATAILARRRPGWYCLPALFAFSSAASGEGMICNPGLLTPSTTVSVTLPLPHGMDLAIADPEGEFWFVCFQQPDSSARLQPIYSQSICRDLPFLTLTVDTMGVNFAEYRKDRVFGEAGRYKVMLSDALETEDPLLQGECEIEFRPTQVKP